MLDVVPPGGQNPSSLGRAQESTGSSRAAGRLAKRRRGDERQPQPPAAAGPRTVQLDWRLPARLRRPIREELDRQRRKQRQRQAIVQFERRPVISSVPSAPPSYRAQQRATPPENTGAEHHTGDVYRNSRPEVAVTVPPYMGSFARRFGVTPRIRTSRPGPAAARPARQAATPAPSPAAAQAPSPTPRRRRAVRARSQSTQVPVTGERDIPFNWANYGDVKAPAELMPESSSAFGAGIAEPKRRFALPLHFSVWPFGRGSASDAVSAPAATSKKKRLVAR